MFPNNTLLNCRLLCYLCGRINHRVGGNLCLLIDQGSGGGVGGSLKGRFGEELLRRSD
jgi:hypothetical protein